MSTAEKMLRVAAIVGHEVGNGKPQSEAIRDAARWLGISTGAVAECVQFGIQQSEPFRRDSRLG